MYISRRGLLPFIHSMGWDLASIWGLIGRSIRRAYRARRSPSLELRGTCAHEHLRSSHHINSLGFKAHIFANNNSKSQRLSALFSLNPEAIEFPVFESSGICSVCRLSSALLSLMLSDSFRLRIEGFRPSHMPRPDKKQKRRSGRIPLSDCA